MMDNNEVQFFIKTPDGRTIGPFMSKMMAEMAVATLPTAVQPQCIVEGKTPDGKTVLLG